MCLESRAVGAHKADICTKKTNVASRRAEYCAVNRIGLKDFQRLLERTSLSEVKWTRGRGEERRVAKRPMMYSTRIHRIVIVSDKSRRTKRVTVTHASTVLNTYNAVSDEEREELRGRREEMRQQIGTGGEGRGQSQKGRGSGPAGTSSAPPSPSCGRAPPDSRTALQHSTEQ